MEILRKIFEAIDMDKSGYGEVGYPTCIVESVPGRSIDRGAFTAVNALGLRVLTPSALTAADCDRAAPRRLPLQAIE